MTNFAFASRLLQDYFLRKSDQKTREAIPPFCSDLLLELSEQVRGYDFTCPVTAKGDISVRMFEHTLDQVWEFVDWTAAIWNQAVRPSFHSRRFTLRELVTDQQLRDGWGGARDTVLSMFEHWREFDDVYTDEYIPVERYPMPRSSEDPFATPGNLCAAFGLAVLDEALCLWERCELEPMLVYFGAAWQCASIARWQNHLDMSAHFNEMSHSQRMAKAAAARYKSDPKQDVKREVKACWRSWKSKPAVYPSIAAFSRDMINKWPDVLKSEAVIGRWVRDWQSQD